MGFLLVFTLMLIAPTGFMIYGINVINLIGGLGLFAVVGNVFRVQVTTWWQRKKRDLM